MKILITIIFVSLAGHAASQNDIQKCAKKKNDAVLKSLGTKPDSSAKQEYVQLDLEWQQCIVGKPVPFFHANGLNNEEINSEKLKGKIIVANFWFTSCPPCIAEMPALNRLVSEFKDKGVVFLAFTFEDKKDLKKFLVNHQLDFKIIPGAQSVSNLFGVLEYPTNFVLDQNGKVAMAFVGGETEEEAKTSAYLKIKAVLESLLKKQ